jgi:dTDP-4-dehydrorhamnose 3,5-epimerase
VVRGLHYQVPPKGQAKLVRVTRGEIYDVAVDIRKGSPWFGRSVSTVLNEDNMKMLYIPEGFAHGFCVLSETADIIYKVSGEYSREHEGGILWNDPAVGIPWPVRDPVVSERDARLPAMRDADVPFQYVPPREEVR